MRASRLVSILLLLQTRGQLSAPQLAAELEVSVRTIYRDVESLGEAGVPIYGDAGPAGGYRLLGGYRTRLTGLTADEAEALQFIGMPGAAAELGLGTVLAAAQLKLHAALPERLRERSARIQERFFLDAPGWYHDGDSSPHLDAIADAVWRQQRIEVRYRRWAAPTDVTRTLEPHGIVLKAGKWYVVARCEGALRTYRISQVLNLTPLNERFERLAEFDLPRYWAAHIARFRAGLRQGEATIRLSPDGRERARDLLSPEVTAAIDATARADEGGWVTAVVPIESLQHAQSSFLGLGAGAEILEPASLRALMAETAAALARLYAPGTGSAGE
ncbi:MAG: YafY family protein [Trebonia sp.]|jgi:predicted DNA-binding transcriptional regulator YafY